MWNKAPKIRGKVYFELRKKKKKKAVVGLNSALSVQQGLHSCQVSSFWRYFPYSGHFSHSCMYLASCKLTTPDLLLTVKGKS